MHYPSFPFNLAHQEGKISNLKKVYKRTHSRDESITTSEVSTPSSYFDSSDQSKDEIDTVFRNIVRRQIDGKLNLLYLVVK